jgi:excisionase family DNA binding protein
MKMGPEVLTVEEVAQLLHLHVMTVYRLAKEGKLPGFKVGGRWRFQREVLEQWMVDRAQLSRMEAENRRLEENNGQDKDKP